MSVKAKLTVADIVKKIDEAKWHAIERHEIERAAMALMCRELITENLLDNTEQIDAVWSSKAMREVIDEAVVRLRKVSVEASIYDPDEPDIVAGMRIAYANPPENTIDGWMCADIVIVCEFARSVLRRGSNA